MTKSERTKRVAFNIAHDANKAMHRLATYLDRNPANLMRDLLEQAIWRNALPDDLPAEDENTKPDDYFLGLLDTAGGES